MMVISISYHYVIQWLICLIFSFPLQKREHKETISEKVGETREGSERKNGGETTKTNGQHSGQKGREDQEESQEDDQERKTRAWTQRPRVKTFR